MSLNNNLQGKPVYNMGSHAPNRGQVSPGGYVKRGLQNYAKTYQNPGVARTQSLARPQGQAAGTVDSASNYMRGNRPLNPNVGAAYAGVSQVGADGESDTRSGLAKQALQDQFRTDNAYTGALTGGYTQGIQDVSNSKLLTVSPVGELKLPYNFAYAKDVMKATSDANMEIQEGLEGRQQAAIEYLRQLMAAQDQGALEANNTLDDFASRGVAFSSGHGRKVADNMRNFNNVINTLNANETQSQQAFINQKAMIENALYEQVGQAALASGYDLSKDAGKWNLKKKPKKKGKK